MGLLSRGLWGAGLGGILGYANTGSATGALGGAAGGAAFGSLGVGIGASMLKKRGGIAGMLQGGLGRLGGLSGSLYKSGIGNLSSNMGTARAAIGSLGMRGSSLASSFIGKNSALTNRIGGAGLAALGGYSAALMGSNLLNSNRGYR